MNYYAGLDISMKETAVCVIDEAGKIIYESMEITDPSAIKRALEESKVDLKIVGLETGSISRWLALKLEKEGFNIVVIDARLMSGVLKVNINKNDKNDARGIADAIRGGIFKKIHLKSDENCQLRTLLNSRKTIVDERTKMLVTIRGHLKSEGFRLESLSSKNIESKLSPILEKCSELLSVSLSSLMRIIVCLHKEISNLDRIIEEFNKDREDVKLLQTIPGVGPIVSVAFLAEIDDLSRFPDGRTAAAYLGLTPRQYASGDTCVMGRISKHGNSETRSLLYQAGLLILTRCSKWSKLKAWGMRIQKKSGTKKAAVAIARKLATIMFQMLITRKEFIYGEPRKIKMKNAAKETITKEAVTIYL